MPRFPFFFFQSPTKKSQKRIMMDKGDDDHSDTKATKTNSSTATKLSENVSKSAQSEPSSPILPPTTTPRTNVELERDTPEESSSQEESQSNQSKRGQVDWTLFPFIYSTITSIVQF